MTNGAGMGALPLYLGLACALLAGLMLSGGSVARAHRDHERRQRRFLEVLEPHLPQTPGSSGGPIVLVRTERDAVSLPARVAAAFGVLPHRSDHCPLPMGVLVVLCLVAAFGACWLAAALLGPAAWVSIVLVWPMTSRWLLGWLSSRRTKTLFKQFPDALAMIVRGVRVGIPVSDSVRAVATEAPLPTSLEFRKLADELAIGVALEEALRNMAARTQLQEYRFFATALALQNQTGGRLSETLESLADTIRKRVMVRARGHALAAETRTSSGVLAVLPFIAFAGLLLLNPAYAEILFVDPKGHMVLAGAVMCLGTGIFLMRTMISRSLS